MSNINKFDEYVGCVFGILYESFPIPTDLNIGDVLGVPDLYSSSGIPPEMDTEANIATYSVIWLANTGYIKMTGNSGNEFFDLTLTEKGLQVLKAYLAALPNNHYHWVNRLPQRLSLAQKKRFVHWLMKP
ncbi:hypothetical protein [Yersinia enterocolitica]|uniref:hypothetical protein n=1 Tax=Yersinia enterocolitica TaxID=630 RepID=UPI002AC3BDAB|nr:hypothetical protein [Yersinia enterocolitica]